MRNDVSSGGHWIKVKLIGVQTNRSAIGSRVTVHYGSRKQAQEVLAQSSFVSVNDTRLHFGLGAETSVKIEVRWTNGGTQSFQTVGVDRLVTIREGAGIVSEVPWAAKKK